MGTSYDRGMDSEQWFTRNEEGQIVKADTDEETNAAVAAGRPVFCACTGDPADHLTQVPNRGKWPSGWTKLGYTVDPPPDAMGPGAFYIGGPA